LVPAQCVTCRTASCPDEAAACEASAPCRTLRDCIDNAGVFQLIGCIGGATPQARSAYGALADCGSASCALCPAINI
jgi:hypothetical protein